MAEGSLALEHLVLLLCGLADDLGRKRNTVQSSAGRRMEPRPAAQPPFQNCRNPSPRRQGLKQAQLAESTWLTASQTHPRAPTSKGTRQTHLPVSSLNGLDHHCLLGMDFGTPLFRACFCNRSIHTLSLTEFRPGCSKGWESTPGPTGQREDSHPFSMDLVLFQQDFYHLSLSPVSGSVDPRISPMVEMRLGTNKSAPDVNWFRRAGPLRPRPPSTSIPHTSCSLSTLGLQESPA